MAKILEFAARALDMSPERAHLVIEGLQAAFELEGKHYTFDKAARVVINALKGRRTDDADVRFAAEWLGERRGSAKDTPSPTPPTDA